MIDKSRKIAKVVKRRKVNRCCDQETKLKGKRPKEICEVYKVVYSSRTITRNGVGVIMDENHEMKSKVEGNLIEF